MQKRNHWSTWSAMACSRRLRRLTTTTTTMKSRVLSNDVAWMIEIYYELHLTKEYWLLI